MPGLLASSKVRAVTVKARPLSGYVVVCLFGAVSSPTAPILAGHLTKAHNQQRPPYGMIIDLSGASLRDVSGVGALMMSYWLDTGFDNSIRLVVHARSTREALFAARIDWLAPIYSTVQEAVDAGPDAE